MPRPAWSSGASVDLSSIHLSPNLARVYSYGYPGDFLLSFRGAANRSPMFYPRRATERQKEALSVNLTIKGPPLPDPLRQGRRGRGAAQSLGSWSQYTVSRSMRLPMNRRG